MAEQGADDLLRGVSAELSPKSRVAVLAAAANASSNAQAVARQLSEAREQARHGVTEGLEAQLAIGLEAVDESSAMLLGRVCRRLDPDEDPEIFPSRRGEGFDEDEAYVQDEDAQPCLLPQLTFHEDPPELPKVVPASDGGRLAPSRDEFARLEGFRWQQSAGPGRTRGTVFHVQRFGTRGEGVLVPAFCEVREPESRPYLEAPGRTGGRKPQAWLAKGLRELVNRVKDKPRANLDGIQKAVEVGPRITLVVPSAVLAIGAPPSAAMLGRRAVRRHALYLDAVEMGARVTLSVVPAANTASGDLDGLDLEKLRSRTGALIFPIDRLETCRLCLRKHGGPPFDPFRINGASLDAVCSYLAGGWSHTLGANPSCWIRLSVRAAPCAALEISLGPAPGRGVFAPFALLSAHADGALEPRCCGYCDSRGVVGWEVVDPCEEGERSMTMSSQDDDDPASRSLMHRGQYIPVCSACSAFVPGSTGYQKKEVLAQHLSGRPLDAILGSADDGLDVLFTQTRRLPRELTPGSPRSSNGSRSPSPLRQRRRGVGPGSPRAPSSGGMSPVFACHRLSAFAQGERDVPRGQIDLQAARRLGWPDDAIVPNGVVLAASGVLRLEAPAGAAKSLSEARDALEHELCIAAGCERQAVGITLLTPQVRASKGVLMGFHILHPAALQGASDPVGAAAVASDPLGALGLYRRLMEYLIEAERQERMKVLERQGGRRRRLLGGAKQEAERQSLLKAMDLSELAEPCSLLVCVPPPAFFERTRTASRPNDASPQSLLLSISQRNSACPDAGMAALPAPECAEDTAQGLARRASDAGTALRRLGDIIGQAERRLVGESPEVDHLEDRRNLSDFVFRDAERAERAEKQRQAGRLQLSSRGATSASSPGASPAMGQRGVVCVDRGTAFAAVVEYFRPDYKQLALRLRELASAGEADRCGQLLARWGGQEVDGGIAVSLAVLGRDPTHFRGQSALDLGLANCLHETTSSLLQFVPDAKTAEINYSESMQEDDSPFVLGEAALRWSAPAGDSASPSDGGQPMAAAASAPAGKPSARAAAGPLDSIAEQPRAQTAPTDTRARRSQAAGRPTTSASDMGPEAAMPLALLLPAASEIAARRRQKLQREQEPESEEAAVARDSARGFLSQIYAMAHACIEADEALRRQEEREAELRELELELEEVRRIVGQEAAVRREEMRRIKALAREEILELLNSPNPVTRHPPLYAAVRYPNDRSVALVSSLVKRRADLSVRSSAPKELEPPLVAATRRGERRLVAGMIRLAADPNATTACGVTVLQVAAERGNVGVLQAIVCAMTCNIDQLGSDGRTPLVTALKTRGDRPEIAKILVEAMCNVGTPDRAGAVPILHSVAVKDARLCRLMLDRRADPNALDPASGARVLILAAQANNQPLMHALLAAQADVATLHPEDRRSALHLVAGLCAAPLVQKLLALRAEVDAQNTVGDTPLRISVQQQDIASAEMLLIARADANRANRSGCAPIHAAVSTGNVNLTQLLARYNADLELADKRRWRPIHYGASGGSREVVSLLLDSLADPTSRSYHGVQPQHLSRKGASEVLASVGCPIDDKSSQFKSRQVPQMSTTFNEKGSARYANLLASHISRDGMEMMRSAHFASTSLGACHPSNQSKFFASQTCDTEPSCSSSSNELVERSTGGNGATTPHALPPIRRDGRRPAPRGGAGDVPSPWPSPSHVRPRPMLGSRKAVAEAAAAAAVAAVGSLGVKAPRRHDEGSRSDTASVDSSLGSGGSLLAGVRTTNSARGPPPAKVWPRHAAPLSARR